MTMRAAHLSAAGSPARIYTPFAIAIYFGIGIGVGVGIRSQRLAACGTSILKNNGPAPHRHF